MWIQKRMSWRRWEVGYDMHSHSPPKAYAFNGHDPKSSSSEVWIVAEVPKKVRGRITGTLTGMTRWAGLLCAQLVREKLQEALSADLRAQRLSAVTDQEKRPGLLDFFRGRRAGYGWSCPLRNDIQIKSASLQFVCAIR
eukprot:s1557_g12.t1